MKIKYIIIVILSSFILIFCYGQTDTLDYFGQVPPGNIPKIFAPGIVSLPGRFERTPAFSLDGKEFFFTVTTPSFVPIIMHMKVENDEWTDADTAFFAKVGNNTEPFFAPPDGQKLFFASNRPPGSPPYNFDIWMIERTEDGWTDPQHLGSEVNSGSSDYHPSVTSDGTLYFVSTRSGNPDIYKANYINGIYSEAENLGTAINTGYKEWDPYISSDESFLIFKSDRPGGYGDLDGYICFKNEDGSWSQPENMGPTLNTQYVDDIGDISLDGKYLFFARRTAEEMDIYWVDAAIIEQFRPATTSPVIKKNNIISEFELSQNHPNPFNPSTIISYNLPRPGFVTLKIYTLLGQEIETLIESHQKAGNHEIAWKAEELASGIYFYRLQVGKYIVTTKKMLLLN